MTVAVLTRPSARLPRPRPGLRRGLMAGASLVLHIVVLGSMVLLAADDDRPLVEPLAPIIQLEIERPPLPPQWRPRPQPPEPLRPVEPETQPQIQPQTEPPVPAEAETQPPLPRPIPAPTLAPTALPTPAPLPSVQIAPGPAPAPTPAPLPVQTLNAPKPLPALAPAPTVAPVVAPVVAPAPAPAVAPAEAAPSLPAPALPARRPAKDKDEEEAASGPPSPPAPRLALPAPSGAPAPAAGGITDAWRVAPEGQAGRNARALRTSPAGCPSTRVLRPGEEAVCDERFNARAAEGAERAITGSGNAQRDARFAREGAREMQRYEAQRRPLSGGVGVVGPADCPGSNFGNGCAGSHLDSSMQMDSTRNVQTRRDGPPASGRPVTPGAAAPREPQ